MFPSYSTRFSARFALFPALISLIFSACALWQKPTGETPGAAPGAPDELRTAIPFSTREPEVFEAEIVVTANGVERRTFLARSGARRRCDYDFGAKNQLTALVTDKFYLLVPGRKIFAEADGAENFAAGADDWQNFLTNAFLSAKTNAKFDKLEAVDNLTRYKITPDDKNYSEILISIDEALGLPVRQEFYSLSGDQRTLTLTIELKNIKLQTEESTFLVPNDFKKVPADELRRIWRGIEN